MDEKWVVARRAVSNIVAYTNALIDTYKTTMENVSTGKVDSLMAIEGMRGVLYLFASDIIKEAKKIAAFESKKQDTEKKEEE